MVLSTEKKTNGYIDLGFAKLDHRRSERQGFPEAVYSPSKTNQQLLIIARRYLAAPAGSPLIFTRLKPAQAKILARLSRRRSRANHQARALAFLPKNFSFQISKGQVHDASIAVITAGTGDIPAAEEAAFTCEVLGSSVRRLYDVGVAGIHRLYDNSGHLEQLSCAIVCAGMEGALPSVVGGLCPFPIIGVPTSVGYGISEGGRTALQTMLSSCASNVCVVNIDNGFSAGIIAHLIANTKKISDLGRKSHF
ncbi:MAG: nickel pincer cofactor biosynthesis protein LarB [Elusimicrobia bacterium]|nr:nickel pincer cofactor biosynthesis protein LarB [Elusimicrobiota bacterium]